MHELILGARYPHPLPPNDGSVAEFCRGGHTLITAIRHPLAAERRLVRAGPRRWGLVTEGPAILLLLQMANGDWWDAPFNPSLIPATEYTPVLPPGATPQTRLLYQYVALERRTGEILALRASTLSPDFTQALHGAIESRRSTPPRPGAFDTALRRLYSLPTPALVRRSGAFSDVGA